MNKAKQIVESFLCELEATDTNINETITEIKDLSARLQTIYKNISDTTSDSNLKALAFKYMTVLKDMDTAINGAAEQLVMQQPEPETIDTEV